LLSRREHSRTELERKLKAKGVPADFINSILDLLLQEGLQSDRRFTESYLHSRSQKGYGPVRLRQELRERGIADELIEESIAGLELDWLAAVHATRLKKFGKTLPRDIRAKAREARFLQHRGYTMEQIRYIYKNNED
jgi:regulatory protein